MAAMLITRPHLPSGNMTASPKSAHPLQEVVERSISSLRSIAAPQTRGRGTPVTPGPPIFREMGTHGVGAGDGPVANSWLCRAVRRDPTCFAVEQR